MTVELGLQPITIPAKKVAIVATGRSQVSSTRFVVSAANTTAVVTNKGDQIRGAMAVIFIRKSNSMQFIVGIVR
jgi:hypothetical protein